MVFVRTIALLILAVLWLGFVPSASADEPAVNDVLVELIERGVPIGPSARITLPSPTMPDGLDAAARQAALESIADAVRPLPRLLRESVVAPFVLKIEKEEVPGRDSPARRIDLWFIAYGSLESLKDEEFLKDMAQVAESSGSNQVPSESVFLEPEDLAKRDLFVRDDLEKYFHTSFGLFDRVQIGATRRAMITITDESILVAAKLDPRFLDDEELPNRWRKVSRDELGQLEFGPSHPYTGAGFYVKVTQLKKPDGALFIEYHQVFDEPKDWFNGANLLRSKLPLIVQDGVRKFRRKLKNATPSSEDTAAGG